MANAIEIFIRLGIFFAILVGILSPTPSIGESNLPTFKHGDFLFGDPLFKLLDKNVRHGQIVALGGHQVAETFVSKE